MQTHAVAILQGVLEGAEVALIMFIVVAAGLVNHTRVRSLPISACCEVRVH